MGAEAQQGIMMRAALVAMLLVLPAAVAYSSGSTPRMPPENPPRIPPEPPRMPPHPKRPPPLPPEQQQSKLSRPQSHFRVSLQRLSTQTLQLARRSALLSRQQLQKR